MTVADVSARDRLFWSLWDNYTPGQKRDVIDAYRDEVALDMGRDALRDGLRPFLARLVGEPNARAFFDAHAHELAEKIRNTPLPDDFHGDYQRWGSIGADWAADLIDPEARPAVE
jgi:hypothetical protein